MMNVGGFNKAEAKKIKVEVGEQRDVNFNLELAGQRATVVVTSELPLIESTRTDTSTVITDREVAVLPTTTPFASGGVANDYEGLALAAPAVRYDLTTNSNDLIGQIRRAHFSTPVPLTSHIPSSASTKTTPSLRA